MSIRRSAEIEMGTRAGGGRLRTVGVISSTLRSVSHAPMQGREGAPDAWLEVRPWAASALDGIAAGDELVVITWLHRARRDVLRVHPRSDPWTPLTGVFATRSPDRPNPLGLHPVIVRAVEGHRLRIGPIEAIDGTPVVDVKVLLPGEGARSLPAAPSPLRRGRTRTRPEASRRRR
jgi:tRNA-Thr(GGU) m(6)t(6)A37 methyltransferase TsaA